MPGDLPMRLAGGSSRTYRCWRIRSCMVAAPLLVSEIWPSRGPQLNRCGRRSRSTITAWGAQPLIYRCDLYRLSFVLRQGAAERHAN